MTDVLTARALLLDMDGTLVDSTAAVERIWSDWARANGVDVDRVLAVAHGRQGQYVMAELLPDRSMDRNHADNEAMLAREARETEGIVEVPGAQAFLASLAGIPHAIVTSASRPLLDARMEAAGLTVPALAVVAEDVAESKPSPEGYLRGAELLGVAPSDCVVFEDSRAGIAAGRAAGMPVVGVGPAAREYEPDVAVDDLTRVRVRRGADGSVEIELS